MRDIDKIIKDRLEGYESSLPEGSLEAFHTRRDKVKQTVRPARGQAVFKAACYLAAAALALFLVMNLRDVKDSPSLKTEKEELAIKEDLPVHEAPIKTMDVLAASNQLRVKTAQRKPAMKAEPVKTDSALSPITVLPKADDAAMDQPAEIDSLNDTPAQRSQTIEKRKTDAMSKDMSGRKWQKENDLKKKNHVVPASAGILAAGAASGLVSFLTGGKDNTYPIAFASKDYLAITKYNNSSQTVIYMPAGATSVTDRPNEISGTVPQDEILESSFSHHMPLVIGLSMRIPLRERLSLTTGIEYSLYTSTLKGLSLYSSYGNGSISKMGTQKAKYLGFPLRLDYTLARNRWIEVYVGGGSKLDFCIGATLNGEKLNKDGLHFSVLGAGGIQLNMTKTLGLYLEPRLSWATLCSKEVLETFRSKHPLTFSISSGFRLTIP